VREPISSRSSRFTSIPKVVTKYDDHPYISDLTIMQFFLHGEFSLIYSVNMENRLLPFIIIFKKLDSYQVTMPNFSFFLSALSYVPVPFYGPMYLK
jgi:hypothetical protein